MQTGLQGFLTKIIKQLTRKGFQGSSSLLLNNSSIQEFVRTGFVL
jgi:hypothetical protein